MFFYKNKQLYCENVPIEKIISKTGTPTYIYSKNKIIENLNAYEKAFSPVSHTLCYAVKANTNLSVCKTIFAQGAGADVVSGGELYIALKAGAQPGKIVFAGVGKTREEIRYAIRSKILMFNAESVQEIALINKIAKQEKTKVRLAIRINPHVDAHTHKYITTGKSESKFGISYKRAFETYLLAGKYGNLKLSGIHCHIGSQITSTFRLMAKRMAELFIKLQHAGINIEYLDIGGGLGIKYHNEIPPAPGALAKEVLALLKPLNVKLILEPGRYIVGNAGSLITKVTFTKKSGHKNFLIVDAGMNDLIRPALYEAYHEILPVRQIPGSKKVFDIVGPICETADFFGKTRHLPDIKQGALIAIMCAGAYGFSMSSQYNSRPRLVEVLVYKNSWKIIRKRETYKDLI
ncbi:MAG: diaminopimelate decarboxylase [Elusimicrobia bacterium]|nr:diaminopimelate decarboxylase [Elusimicrobiota bacterium]